MATIKGVWILNEILDPPQPSVIQQEVNFTFFSTRIFQGTGLHIYESTGNYGPTILNYEYVYPTGVWTVYNSRNGWANQTIRTVDFGSVEQEVSEEWYAWLTANATPQASEEEISNTLITYDGVTVEMDGDLPATLECEGKKARTDIVIIPAFPIKIAYGGIVHTADEGTPATLVCSGKKMRADVVITAEITTNFFLADGSMLITSDGQIFETQ